MKLKMSDLDEAVEYYAKNGYPVEASTDTLIIGGKTTFAVNAFHDLELLYKQGISFPEHQITEIIREKVKKDENYRQEEIDRRINYIKQIYKPSMARTDFDGFSFPWGKKVKISSFLLDVYSSSRSNLTPEEQDYVLERLPKIKRGQNTFDDSQIDEIADYIVTKYYEKPFTRKEARTMKLPAKYGEYYISTFISEVYSSSLHRFSKEQQTALQKILWMFSEKEAAKLLIMKKLEKHEAEFVNGIGKTYHHIAYMKSAYSKNIEEVQTYIKEKCPALYLEMKLSA